MYKRIGIKALLGYIIQDIKELMRGNKNGQKQQKG